MLSETVDIRKPHKGLKELLRLVSKGVEVVFVEDDVPVARLIPAGQRIAGLHADVPYTVSDDFDAPLPDSFWTGNE